MLMGVEMFALAGGTVICDSLRGRRLLCARRVQGWDSREVMPSRRAYLVSCATLCAPTFFIILRRWVSMVLELTPMAAAISLVLWPSAIWRRICFSRPESGRVRAAAGLS